MKGFPLLRVFLLVLLIIDTVFLMSIGGCAKYSEEVQANLTKLETTKSCPGCNLTGVELMKFDLTGVNLARANLTNANLSRANLTDADLTDANLSNAILTNTILVKTKIINTNLNNVKLSYANINGSEIFNSSFIFNEKY